MASIPGFTTKAVVLPLMFTIFKLTPRSPPWRTGNNNLLDAACSAMAGGESTRFTQRISRPAGPKLLLTSWRRGSSTRQAGHCIDQKCSSTTLPLKSARDTVCPDGFCNLKSAILNGLGYMKMLAFEERSEANTVPWKTNRTRENRKSLRVTWVYVDFISPPVRFGKYKYRHYNIYSRMSIFFLHDGRRAYN